MPAACIQSIFYYFITMRPINTFYLIQGRSSRKDLRLRYPWIYLKVYHKNYLISFEPSEKHALSASALIDALWLMIWQKVMLGEVPFLSRW